jgi:hypothetical protein
VGGYAATASGRPGAARQATLEVKVPSDRFDDLTGGLDPIGRLSSST